MAIRMKDDELLALPVTIDVPTAGRAWGFGREKSYALAAAGAFPCEVRTLGGRKVVLKAALLAALGIRWPVTEGAPADAA